MKVKKLIATIAMALVGLMMFSSCFLFIDEENAAERISKVQPDKQVNRAVVTDDTLIIDVDGEQKEVNFLTEAKKYYAVGKEPRKGKFQRYGEWMYYEYGYDKKVPLVGEETLKLGLMRSNIYTGETENIYDFGETYSRVYSSGIQGGRYFFVYAQGVLKVLDMETNQFTYEDCIEEKSEIEQALSQSHKKYNVSNYSFYDYTYNKTWDYIKDGQYYYYMGDGTYQELSVPDWIVAEEGTMSHLSLSRVENYIHTVSYKDIEEERKAYDLVEGVEVDYMTVVKPLKEKDKGKRQPDYKEEVFVSSPGVLVQVEGKNYEISMDAMNYVIGSGVISRYELREDGYAITETAFKMDGAYLKEHNEALQQLSKLWNPAKEGGLTCGRVCLSGGRVFFNCCNYYGTWLVGAGSAYYLCELDPITMEVEYLGYYLSSADALYLL